jgi:hypothetical protein
MTIKQNAANWRQSLGNLCTHMKCGAVMLGYGNVNWSESEPSRRVWNAEFYSNFVERVEGRGGTATHDENRKVYIYIYIYLYYLIQYSKGLGFKTCCGTDKSNGRFQILTWTSMKTLSCMMLCCVVSYKLTTFQRCLLPPSSRLHRSALVTFITKEYFLLRLHTNENKYWRLACICWKVKNIRKFTCMPPMRSYIVWCWHNRRSDFTSDFGLSVIVRN